MSIKKGFVYICHMQHTAKDIAALIGGTVEGNRDQMVSKFSKLEEAEQDSLCFFANERYAEYLTNTPAAILIVSTEFSHTVPANTTLIRCSNPYEATAKLLAVYEKKQALPTGIEVGAFVSPSAVIGSGVSIAATAYIAEQTQIGDQTIIFPQTYIGPNVKIGTNTKIYPGVKIYADCIIGDHCIIHAGVVIGSDGFGFAPSASGEYQKVPQIGNVVIEHHVEIGANTVIDRATMGSTVIHEGSKIDNLVQIAHNVVIGKRTVIAAQTGISGSTKVGDQCMIGGQVGIVGHITIGDRSRINAQSGVSKTMPPGSTVTGSPAWEYTPMLKAQALIKRLPEILDRLVRMEKKLDSQ